MLTVLATAGLAASLLVAPLTASTSSKAAPIPPNTSFRLASLNGSGCPADEQSDPVVTRVGEASLRIKFDGMDASVGPYTDPVDFRKNCLASIEVSVPDGYAFTISGAAYAGDAKLEAGLTGTQRASYYIQGESDTTVRTHPFTGPYSADWDTLDSFTVEDAVWSPCGGQRNINVNTELRITGSKPKTTNSMSLGPELNFSFAFRTC